MFAHLLAELRLAFGLLDDPEFLHAPYVDSNVKIIELFESCGKLQEVVAITVLVMHFTGFLARHNMEWVVFVVAAAVFPAVLYL